MVEEYSEKYKRYTFEELQSVLKFINKEAYPERFELAKSELENRLKDKQNDPHGDINNLATLSDRFAAMLVDFVVSGLPIIVLYWLIFGLNGLVEFEKENRLIHSLILMIFSQGIYLLINGELLHKYGQTVGKRFLEIKIVDADNNLPEFKRSYGLRYLVPIIINSVPFIGFVFTLLDSLFIFNKDRRCIHDHIADTRVVKV